MNETLEHLAADYPVSARLRYLLKQGPRTTRELADATGEDIATVRHALRLQMQDAEPVGDHLRGGPTPGLWRLVEGRPRQEQRRGPRLLSRGDRVVVLDWQDRPLERRVWGLSGEEGVAICSDAEYQRARATGDEPLYVGFPITSVQKVLESV